MCLVMSSRGGRHSFYEGSDSTETRWDYRKRCTEGAVLWWRTCFSCGESPSQTVKLILQWWKTVESSECTWTSGHWCFNMMFCATTQQRCRKVPVSTGTGRKLLAWSSSQAVKRASNSHHGQWGELPTTPLTSACCEACVLQPRNTLSTGICVHHMMLFLMQKANYPHLSSMVELSQEEGTPEWKNENYILPLPKQTALLPDP